MMIEMIGFIISLLALVYLALQQMGRKKSTTHVEEERESLEERQYREQLDELFGSFEEPVIEDQDEEEEEFEEVPLTPIVIRKFPLAGEEEAQKLKSQIQEEGLESVIEKRYDAFELTPHEFELAPHHYDEKVKKVRDPYSLEPLLHTPTFLRALFKKKRLVIKQAVILHEIIGKPKSIEPYDERR